MHESSARLPQRREDETAGELIRALLRCINMAVVDAGAAGGELLFSAVTMHSAQPALVALLPEASGLKVGVHHDDAMAGPLLLDEVKDALRDTAR